MNSLCPKMNPVVSCTANAVRAACLAFVVAVGAPNSGFGQDAAERILVTEVNVLNARFVETANLGFERPGILGQVKVAEGDAVSNGQLIAALATDVAHARLAIATEAAKSTAAIRSARKLAEAAKLELRIVTEANSSGETYPKSHVERLRLAREAAEFDVQLRLHERRVALLEIKHAKAELQAHHVTAPIRGIVTAVLKSAGEAVQSGETICSIVNPDVIRAEAHVPVTDAIQIRIGMKAEFQVDLPDADLPLERKVFHGTVNFVDYSLQTVRERVRVTADLQNVDHQLLQGIPGRLRVYREVQK